MRTHSNATTLVLAFCLAILPRWVLAQAPSSNATPTELSGKLQSRLEEARVELGRWVNSQANATNPPAGATAGEAIEYRAALDSLVRIYQQHAGDLARLEAARQREAGAEQTVRTWSGFGEPPPYSVLMVDDLRSAVRSIKAQIQANSTSREVLDSFRAEAGAALRSSDEQIRRLEEQIEATKDTAQLQTLRWQRTLAQMRNRVATAEAGLNDTRRLRLQTELSEQTKRLGLLQRQLALAEAQVRFSQSDFQSIMGRLDRKQVELETEKQAAEQENEIRQAGLAAARGELTNALQEVAGMRQGVVNTNLLALEQTIELRKAQAELAAVKLNLSLQLLELLSRQRSLWEARYHSFQVSDPRRLQQAFAAVERLHKFILAARPHFVQQIEMAGALSAEQRGRIGNASLPQEVLEQARQLLDCYHQREELARRALAGLEELDQLAVAWKEELDEERKAMPLHERIRDLFAGVSGFGSRLWNFELFAIQDTITVEDQAITGRRPVTVGKIASALIILTVGYWLSMLAARLLASLAIRRFKVDRNQAELLRRWARIFIIAALVVFSLVLVKIPLTVFAFLGGALAIGVGFGTQNLLKNFFSGIIILLERPFRVGDVLDVADRRGTITSIGTRASVLELWDGTELLIPNSTLLENNVINWTYSNRAVRFSVSVGVAYGSDTSRVARLLAETVDRHSLVEKHPKPQILFQDFGESALTFEVRFWVDVVHASPAQVASDLRHMVSVAFAQNGIVIAFPQRDVHLDATRPVPVQVVGDAPPTMRT